MDTATSPSPWTPWMRFRGSQRGVESQAAPDWINDGDELAAFLVSNGYNRLAVNRQRLSDLEAIGAVILAAVTRSGLLTRAAAVDSSSGYSSMGSASVPRSIPTSARFCPVRSRRVGGLHDQHEPGNQHGSRIAVRTLLHASTSAGRTCEPRRRRRATEPPRCSAGASEWTETANEDFKGDLFTYGDNATMFAMSM